MRRNLDKPQHVFVIRRDGKPYRYMARVTVKFEKKYLGCFKTEAEAVTAVKKYFKNPEKYERR